MYILLRQPVLHDQAAVDNQCVEEEKQILRDKVDEMQKRLEELVEKLQNTEEQLDDYQSRFAKVRLFLRVNCKIRLMG